MTARIQPVEQMVKAVYGQIDLGDPRRDRRLLQVATECMNHPGQKFSRIFDTAKA